MIINRLTKDKLEKIKMLNIEERYEILEEYYYKNTSIQYFPSNLIAFYPSIKEYHSRDNIICDFSANLIKKGQLYINYRPLIENLSTGNRYVLKKSIKCKTAYIDKLPNNILEFEQLNEMVMNYNSFKNSNVNLDNLHYSQGGYLKLLRLKK